MNKGNLILFFVHKNFCNKNDMLFPVLPYKYNGPDKIAA